MKIYIKLLLIFSLFFMSIHAYGHGWRLNSSDCHNDNVWWTIYHCHPWWDFNIITYPKASTTWKNRINSKELKVATQDEILSEIKRSNRCNSFKWTKWWTDDYNRCIKISKEWDIYSLDEIKNKLLVMRNCSIFSNYEKNYFECIDIVENWIYTPTEIQRISNNYSNCGKIADYFKTDKNLCIDNKAILYKKEKEEDKKQEVLNKYKVKLDKINKRLSLIYLEHPEKIKKLLLQIQNIKLRLQPEDKNYIILSYIEEYLLILIQSD